MSKKIKSLTDDELSELSWEIQETVSRCNTVGEALKLLASSMAAFIDFHVKDKTKRGLIMDACIKQLRQFKKMMKQ